MSAIATPITPPSGTTTPPPLQPIPTTQVTQVWPRLWKWTPDDYEKLGKAGFFTGRRVQLIRGEIIDMGIQGPRHFTAILLTTKAVEAAFGVGYVIRPQGPIALDDSQPEPDVAVVPGSPRDYLVHPRTVLLAIEVSDSSLTYDLTTKAELYAATGIPEYWVLDLETQRLLVFRDPVALPPGGHAYHTHLSFAVDESVTPLAATNPVAVANLLP